MTKTVIITGITSGLGLQSAQKLQKAGYEVIGLVRSPQKAAQLKEKGELPRDIKIIECDLADLSSVASAVLKIKESMDRIEILLNNAGGIFTERKESEDGFELTFAVNHLGHFALTTSLIDLLKKSNSRVINVSSEAHKAGNLNFDDLHARKKFSSYKTYGDGKLCNIYFTMELHRRYHEEGISAFCLHPGVVNTNFFTPFKGFLGFMIKAFNFLMVSPEKGAETQIYLAKEPQLEEYSGHYFKNKKLAKTSKLASDTQKAERLWEISEKLLKEAGYSA